MTMSPKLFGFALISFLHNLFTVIWFGGMIVALLTYMPAVKEALGSGPQSKRVMALFKRKQRIWVYISMAGLLITGLLMSNRSPEFVRLFAVSNPFSIALTVKHVLVLVMIGIALYRSIALMPKSLPAAPAGSPGGQAGPGGRQPGGASGVQSGASKPGGPPGGPQSNAAARREKLNVTLLIINVILAVVVLFNSALVSALAG
jgi:uncharacterized membrane protein